MLGSRVRATLLGLVAMLVAGSFAASSAYAEGGPWFHHRAIGGEGAGAKIGEATPEKIEGKGEKQVLTSKVGGTAIEIASKEVQVNGIIYNNANQGQAKLEITYHEPTLLKPEAKQCKVKIGTNNVVKLFGHQAWKWNGTVGQLTEKPQTNQKRDWIFTASELKPTEQEAKENELKSPAGEFTTVNIEKNTEACLLESKNKANGADGAVVVAPTGLEAWGQTEKLNVPGPQLKQHVWNATTTRFQGIDVGLKLGIEPAELKGNFEVKSPNQEVALFEN